MAQNPDAFIREVDEELRQDRLKQLWYRFAPLIIGVVLVVVLGVAGTMGWQTWRASQRTAEARAFDEATQLASEDQAAAARAFAELANSASTGYGMLARLEEAELYAALDQPQKAQAALEALAEAGDADALYRDYARLLEALRTAESAEPAALIDELESLSNGNGPWRFTARELIGAAHLRAGDREAARQVFTDLAANSSAPPGVRRRAQDLAAALGGDGGTGDAAGNGGS